MMESELKCQNELLELLKDLNIEEETLEMYVFFLVKCMTVEELEKKVTDLEKKKKIIILLKNLVVKLNKQIEPLNDPEFDNDCIMNVDILKTLPCSKIVPSQEFTKRFDRIIKNRFDFDPKVM